MHLCWVKFLAEEKAHTSMALTMERWRHWRYTQMETLNTEHCNERKHINKMCNKFKMNLPTHVCEDSTFYRLLLLLLLFVVNILPIYPFSIEFGRLFISLRLWDCARCLGDTRNYAMEIIILSYVYVYAAEVEVAAIHNDKRMLCEYTISFSVQYFCSLLITHIHIQTHACKNWARMEWCCTITAYFGHFRLGNFHFALYTLVMHS